jgi:hypothetical protein
LTALTGVAFTTDLGTGRIEFTADLGNVDTGRHFEFTD